MCVSYALFWYAENGRAVIRTATLIVMLKKILSLLLILVLCVSMLPQWGQAAAATNPGSENGVEPVFNDGQLDGQLNEPGEPVIIMMAYQDNTAAFKIAHSEFEVYPGLAASYGYSVGAEIQSGEVTALDAIVAAHIFVFGDEKSVINDKLEIDASGFAKNFMGDGYGNMYYYVNGVSPWVSAGETVLNSGDDIRLHSLRDTTAWTDTFSWFESDGNILKILTVTANQPFPLTLMKNAYDENWNTVNVTADNAKIILLQVNDTTGEAALGAQFALTNEDGAATVTIGTPGTYILSAIESDPVTQSPLISPWLVVTVEPEAPGGE